MLLSFSGIGSGISQIPTIIIVQRYFTKKRAIATAVSTIGLSFWSTITSPTVQFLIEIYGWRGAILLIGAINLQMPVPAALYRPPRERSDPVVAKDNEETGDEEKSGACARRLKSCTDFYFSRELFTISFVVFALNQCTRMFTMDSFYIRMAPIGVSIGLDPTTASFLPAIVSISLCFGRVLGGFMAKCMTPPGVYVVFNFLNVFTVFLVPFLPKALIPYGGAALVFGLFMGMYVIYQHILSTMQSTYRSS